MKEDRPLYAEDFFPRQEDGLMHCPGCGAIEEKRGASSFLQHLKKGCPYYLASVGLGPRAADKAMVRAAFGAGAAKP